MLFPVFCATALICQIFFSYSLQSTLEKREGNINNKFRAQRFVQAKDGEVNRRKLGKHLFPFFFAVDEEVQTRTVIEVIIDEYCEGTKYDLNERDTSFYMAFNQRTTSFRCGLRHRHIGSGWEGVI